ncbi:MAG: hypothetical protein IKH90_02600 [Ruminococcus sp.]|nr:hypothetical protein [Ruminococcus sp.]
MFELVPCDDKRYDEYEQLILRRDALKKEAEGYMHLYIHEFGDLIVELLNKKINCIKKKRMIAFCQRHANRGERVNMKELDEYIKAETEEYNKKLAEMTEKNEMCKQFRTLPEDEVLIIKQLYRSIAKKLHPDINPLTAVDEMLYELWNRVTLAYNNNDLKAIQELDFLVNKALSEINEGRITVDIPDISERIEELGIEIDSITSTDPYRYKYILNDPRLIAEKKTELRSQIDEYIQYEKELGEIQQKLMQGGVELLWEI